MASDSEHSQSAQGSAASSSEGEGTQREQRARGQGVASRRRVSQRDQGDSGIDVDLLITCIQERGPLWDSRDPRHMDQVVLRRLWVEVAKSLWDGFESASSSDKSNFVKKLRTRWRSMKDRFNKGLRTEEEQSRSGAAAAKSVPYKYHRALQFLRPVLGRRQTHSSTLERARPSGADLHESPSDPSQPSHSDSRLAPPSGEPAAGPSGVPLPEASGAPSFGNSRQRQRASDRPTMPEFLHLSTVFQYCFKALGDRMDTALSNIDRRLENMESELSRPAKHFFSAIAKGMVEHLTPELQISVMQACNTAYVRALQQARVMQSATMSVVPSLASMTPTPAAEPLQPPHRGPRAERRHHRHPIVPPTPAPARPSSSRSRHDVGAAAGEQRKSKRKRRRTHTEALATPIQTPSSRQGSSRSRSSQGHSRTRQRLVLPPPSPTGVAVSSPVYPAEGLDLPSSLLDSGSSSSSSSPHSQPETYHSPWWQRLIPPKFISPFFSCFPPIKIVLFKTIFVLILQYTSRQFKPCAIYTYFVLQTPHICNVRQYFYNFFCLFLGVSHCCMRCLQTLKCMRCLPTLRVCVHVQDCIRIWSGFYISICKPKPGVGDKYRSGAYVSILLFL
ncbi:uncharacterized protein LOC143815773 isoform X2 [Ranitomeya variabilis]|uniref:uncharacterized protein LOC143815773 isoform X2 n=1 Tax=Ranitomeya variabilis TaxID=490064 RepID=UPI004056E4FD